MNFEESLKNKILNVFVNLGVTLKLDDIVIEHSKDKLHGDFASNIALKYAKELHKSPKDIAETIKNKIDMEGLDKIEIAGPGFINFFISNNSLSSIIEKAIKEDQDFGRSIKQNKKVNVEFVSANPTGDLHLGHARCAAVGDSICRLYDFAGFDVTREFYVNDAGSQINHLRDSIRARYHTILGDETPVPEDGYQGIDVKNIAQLMVNSIGEKYLVDSQEALDYFKNEGMRLELEKIKRDLDLFKVKFDVYSFESNIKANNNVENTLKLFKDYSYLDNGAIFLKTTAFLDDKDRAVVKSNGEYTYFMPDIAYHLNKLSRGYDLLIDILGADHHGYIARMKSALMMRGYKEDVLEIELVQVVRIMQGDIEIKMSKRTGNAITLRDLCEEVGIDAVRYFFVERAASSHLDFDYNLALEQSSSNPVYYAQYAHARLCSLLESAKDIKIDVSASHLEKESELALAKHLNDFQGVVYSAAINREPHKVATYIQKLASLTHSFYTECRVIDRDNLDVTSSRLALVKASQIVIRNALNLVGVSAPNKM